MTENQTESDVHWLAAIDALDLPAGKAEQVRALVIRESTAAHREAVGRITAPPRINETVTVVSVVRTVETLFPDGHYRITVDADLSSPPGSPKDEQ